MLYRKMGKLRGETSVLGFGCMRLPVDKQTGEIDSGKATEMIRYAIDNGINYVDTAWMYHNETSESFLGKALSDGYRQKIRLASKSPVWLIESKQDFHRFFNQQLEKLNTHYLDIYLFHGLNRSKWEKIKKLDLIGEMEKLKKEGSIRYFGFSFHDSFDTFREIIGYYPWDITLLQYNYLDTDYEVTTQGLDLAYAKNIPVIVMEPLRGGKLAQRNDDIDAIIEKAPVKRTPAEWALRFVWSHPAVCCVLSGMNNADQLKENMEYARRAPEILPDEENEVIRQLKSVFSKKIKINCTGCRYCMPCPQGVDIPENFNLLNFAAWEGERQNWMVRWYNEMDDEGNTTDWHGKGKASLCIQCGECIDQCPQKIDIPGELDHVVKVFERGVGIGEV